MSDKQNGKSFWTTFPGILTGFAALLTAIAGIITALYGAGLLQILIPASATASPTAISARPATTAIPLKTVLPSSSPQAPSYKTLSESRAIITDRNGRQTTVPADTLRYCISTGTSIYLENGYTIELDNIKRIDSVRASGGKALFSITLLDNSIIEGEAGCSFFGQTAAGRFELPVEQIRSIEILRQ